MANERPDALIVEGRMRIGRPQLSWENCMKRESEELGGGRRMRTVMDERVETTVKWNQRWNE